MSRKKYFYTGTVKDLERLQLPISQERFRIFINGNGSHILICFGQIYYYIHNEISPTPNVWHKEIIKLLAKNKLITELKDIELYGGKKWQNKR